MNTILHMHQPAIYRLCLQGRVTADWTDWLANPVVQVDGAGAGSMVAGNDGGSAASITVITGTVRDQAALFGLLSFVRDLGVPLISVELIRE